MDEAGVSRASRSIRKRTSESGGVTVKPGTYRVVMTYGNETSETQITVQSDPRLNVSQANIDAIYTTSKRLETLQGIMADAVKQLVESKNISDKYMSDLKKLDKEKYKDAIKESKEISEKIDDLINLYLGKPDKRQGITNSDDIPVSSRLGTASWYTQSRKNGMTTTEETLIKQAEDALNEAITKTNSFYSESWNTYQSNMEKLQLNRFKPVKMF